MSAEFPPDSLPQFNRHGRLTAATSELLDDATVPCLAYGESEAGRVSLGVYSKGGEGRHRDRERPVS